MKAICILSLFLIFVGKYPNLPLHVCITVLHTFYESCSSSAGSYLQRIKITTDLDTRFFSKDPSSNLIVTNEVVDVLLKWVSF